MSDQRWPVAVRKTYKLYIGGAFPRSESGRSYEVTDRKGGFLANAALASRKDARDAVSAARKAFAGWSGATAYNRGQVLYRVAELLEGRRPQFVAEIRAAEGIGRRRPRASWTPRSTAGSGTPAGPTSSPRSVGVVQPGRRALLQLLVPEPTGVVAVARAAGASLLGLVSVVAPALVSGNTSSSWPSEQRPLPPSRSEVLATSDVPGGVVNVLTGGPRRSRRGSPRTPTSTPST